MGENINMNINEHLENGVGLLRQNFKELVSGDPDFILEDVDGTMKILKNTSFPSSQFFFDMFDIPKETVRYSNSYFTELSIEKTAALLSKCKKEEVTVLSAVTVAATLACRNLMKMKRYADIIHLLSFAHSFDLRRYLRPEACNWLGNYVWFVTKDVILESENPLKDCWGIAYQYGSAVHTTLETKSILSLKCLLSQDTKSIIASPFKGKRKIKNIMVTSNMGKLDRLFAGTGKHVEATNLFRASTFGLTVGILAMFHTFRGRFVLNMQYDQQLISSKNIKTITDELLNILDTMVTQ